MQPGAVFHGPRQAVARRLAKVHPKFRTPYVAILLIGVVSLVCTIIFTDEQLTKLVNFGAISSFMMLTSR